MGLIIGSLKDFIPFGSAMLGAVTGGLITYSMSKATKRKEKKLKALESINEVKLLVYDMVMSIGELKQSLDDEYKESGISDSGENLEEYILKIGNFYGKMLVGEWAIAYTKAIHINAEVYSETFNTYTQFYYLNGEVEKSFEKFDEEKFELFVQESLGILQTSYDLLNDLANFLGAKEQELIHEFMNKYIIEKKFYLF
ncbi:hypothetical protein OCA00_25060 [Bacillus cereus]|nr:hypothetical protein [Bacillus cereus]MCU4857745.1 hypothetical protein [Bacillus cereus]MCU4874615.1 hypothetical protein [Bacillus cereus]MCU4941132.1 hypothetical protein [Bacillus cereus]